MRQALKSRSADGTGREPTFLSVMWFAGMDMAQMYAARTAQTAHAEIDRAEAEEYRASSAAVTPLVHAVLPAMYGEPGPCRASAARWRLMSRAWMLPVSPIGPMRCNSVCPPATIGVIHADTHWGIVLSLVCLRRMSRSDVHSSYAFVRACAYPSGR